MQICSSVLFPFLACLAASFLWSKTKCLWPNYHYLPPNAANLDYIHFIHATVILNKQTYPFPTQRLHRSVDSTNNILECHVTSAVAIKATTTSRVLKNLLQRFLPAFVACFFYCLKKFWDMRHYSSTYMKPQNTDFTTAPSCNVIYRVPDKRVLVVKLKGWYKI